LKGFEFEVPPLRDRVDDIPALAEFFAAKHSEATGRKILGLSASLIEKLSHYEFPGNVRELENEIRRIVSEKSRGLGRRARRRVSARGLADGLRT
jgi:two-component system response regulator HupR/HoxA